MFSPHLTSGSEGSQARSEVEVMRLISGEDYYQPASWCLTNLTTLSSTTDTQSFLSWDGATAALVDSLSLQMSGETKLSLHHHHLVQTVLVCGGATTHYQAEFNTRARGSSPRSF